MIEAFSMPCPKLLLFMESFYNYRQQPAFALYGSYISVSLLGRPKGILQRSPLDLRGNFCLLAANVQKINRNRKLRIS